VSIRKDNVLRERESKTIAFYFDFMSPYAYLGSVGIERLAAAHGYEVDWRPMLLGISVIRVMGLKGVADTPLKRDYVRRDVVRCAQYLDIPFERATDEPMTSLPAARAFVWLNERDQSIARVFARAVFRAQWAEAADMSSPAAIASLVGSLGIDANEAVAAMADDGIKRRLREHVDASISLGVFGAPTFLVGKEIFWGVDRLPMIERWLETGGW
jgi:2-hydroxychromene-2-carboxylate isomerase